jgi:lipid II:glycine glycyltransferase (peptidoglycan interpeptide bridge formation enzyme)
MTDIRQTPQYAKYLSLEGWIVERVDDINYFIRRLPLIGSVLKVQRPEKIDFDIIDRLVRKYHVFQTIIEPKTEFDANFLASNGYKLSKSPYLPSKTLQIDLTKSEKAIIDSFKKDARRAIKRAMALSEAAESKGSGQIIKEYSSPDEIIKWREAWKNSVKFDRHVPPAKQLLNLRKSFPCRTGMQPESYSIFLASHNISGRIIGGALFTRSSHDTGYYWYGFTNSEGRTSLSQYSLLYQGILWAKKQGCKVFDFEGIYDERFPIKSWLGFTHFKKSFGGQEVLYPGCFTKTRLPLWGRF